MQISFTLNGKPSIATIEPHTLLIDLLRDGLGLKGTKPGCLEGECGACTVLVNLSPVNSCLFLAANVHGKSVISIEGLAINTEKLDPVQDAIIEHGAVQCGFCTSGMILSIKAIKDKFTEKNIIPDREAIAKNLEGNLCRCTGYVKIIDAVEALFKTEINQNQSV